MLSRSRPRLSREQFLAEMAIEASKFDIEESIDRNGLGSLEEKATIVIRASRIQGRGTGLDITLDDEEPAPEKTPEVKKRPYERPTLRKLEPEEVIRKLNGALEKERPTR